MKRRQPLADTISNLNADIIPLQEVETWLDSNDDSNNLARPWLLAQNPGFRAAAVGS